MILYLDDRNYKENIDRAAGVITDGGLVAFPTETVYGLGANALSADAVSRIFTAKGRPQDNPIIVHVNGMTMAEQIAVFTDKAKDLADAFWPGPLSLVMEATGLPSVVTAGLATVGVRMPDCDAALSLISAAGVPIAAPSANKSGAPSPTLAAHVQSDLGDKILVLDAGESSIGVESTVIDMTSSPPTILRPGAVTQQMIEQIIGKVDHAQAFEAAEELKPASPGMKYRHYAPKAAVTVIEGNHISVAESIKYLYDKDIKAGDKPLVMASRENKKYYGPRDLVITGSIHSPEQAAKVLYSLLRDADEKGYTSIYFEALPRVGIGFAVMNRIYKAAAYNIVKV
ncbi:MAG: threonylcarbamoyl-AMP synthase [Clostridia bacterium]|jgi:L-threonylcarbamoyladenylate synthase|nr:threonylcarbamoyl-AMP synthase [Clostridia bacterium]MBT7121980.1 threonylcarbamoyl-AMP synthase [Clostridia bacterium]